MHFGNTKFKQKPREEQVEADGTASKSYSEATAHTVFSSPTPGLLPSPGSYLASRFLKMLKLISDLPRLLLLKIILLTTLLMYNSCISE